jgi:uncharacterized protein YxjI
MNYPLDLSFKLLALASQIYIRDASGNLIGYVKQKLFKLKEDINIFADEGQTKHLFNIKADRIIDFSANYRFSDSSGRHLGSIKRQGMRSFWKANYDIVNSNGQQILKIHEENGWIKVIDALVGEIPVLGMFTGYLFNPAYIIERVDGKPVMRLVKQPAFFEGKFQLSPQMQVTQEEETLCLLGALTMTLLERSRG